MDNAASDPTTKLSIRGDTENDSIETPDKIKKENKKDILISPEVDLDRKTDEHISYTEDLYVTNGNYTQKPLEPLKDTNGIAHSTGKYVRNEEDLSLTNGLETPKTLEPLINFNKVSAAYGDRETPALPDITEQERRDLEIMETGQFQLGPTISNASEIVEYTEHKKKKKKKKKRRHVMDDEDIHKMNNELDSEMMQEDNSRHKRKKKKRKRNPDVEGSPELSDVMERGNDITQLLTNFGNDMIAENDSPDAASMQLSNINQTHKEEIPMHQWGHFQNKVAPYVDGSDSQTQKKHKKKKRNKVEPEMDHETNNFADDQFVG